MSAPPARVLHVQSMWTSPYVLSCFVTLRAKKLEFTLEPVHLHERAHLEPAFADLSLTARVPTYVEGDFAVSESSAIVEYLEDAYPPPAHVAVLPADAKRRARARQVMAWVRSDLMPIREERSSEYVFFPHDKLAPFAPLSPAGVRAADKLVRAASALVPADGGPLFGAWSIADTDLAMMLQRLHRTGYPLPGKLVTFAEREWKNPPIVEFCDHERPPYQSTS
jgi:glutathione S-transferase